MSGVHYSVSLTGNTHSTYSFKRPFSFLGPSLNVTLTDMKDLY